MARSGPGGRYVVHELLSFEFLSEDRSVQATTFADGTRIAANLGEREVEVDRLGALPPRCRQDLR